MGIFQDSECVILETELISHAKIIIAGRTKLRPLTRGRRACLCEAVSVGFVPQRSACLCLVVPAGEVVPEAPHTCWLAPAGLLRSCAETVLSDQASLWQNRKPTRTPLGWLLPE